MILVTFGNITLYIHSSFMNKYLLLFITMFFIGSAIGQRTSVLTQRYSDHRIGWNDKETKLSSRNVDSASFGLLFSRTVDDQLYAQPLIMANLFIGGTNRNVVFVATVNNTVYAYDADDTSHHFPLWEVNLTPFGARVIRNTDMTGACGGNYNDFTGNIGIVGTPVIDTFTKAIYMISRDIVNSTQQFEQYIHALDIYTGHEKPGSPQLITAAVRGSGDGNPNDTVYFDPQKANQRPALLLYNRTVYGAWASHCDWQNYHGWLIGFDDSTLTKKYVYNDSPDGYEGGFWQSGEGPSVDDSGYVYIISGNGSVGINGDLDNIRGRGESLLKLRPSGDTMETMDFFTPSNYQYLEDNDLDYGTDGTLIIPGTTLSVSGTKDGFLYVLNTDHLGKYSANDTGVVQQFYANAQNVFPRSVHGTPVYYKWSGVSDTECVYVWAATDTLKQLFFDRSAGRFDSSRTLRGNIRLSQGTPGAMLAASSNGKTAGTGVLWAYHPNSGDANQSLVPGRLDAYDARDVRRLLWSSQMNPARDSIGIFAKFSHPVVANGKVYVGTFDGQLLVYGLYREPYDTIIVRDTLQRIDTVIIRDTILSMDTIGRIDTVVSQIIVRIVSDTIDQNDSIRAIYTIQIADTLFGTDTLYITDSLAKYPNGITDINKDLVTARYYPNPATGILTIEYSLPGPVKDLSFEFVDVYGRTVMKVPITGATGHQALNINIEERLCSGIYELVFSGTGVYQTIGKLTKY